MKKKGFTLIELLAVIVILAVIALISMPIILNMINSAKKGSLKDTAYALTKAAENYIALEEARGNKINWNTNKITNEEYISFNLNNEEDIRKLNIKGKTPNKGRVEITKRGDTFVVAIDDNLCAKKDYGEKIVNLLSLKSDNICMLTASSNDLSSDDTNDIISTITNLSSRVEELESKNTTLEKKVSTIEGETIDKIYPVGSIYISTDLNTVELVKEKFGGEWEVYGDGKVLRGTTNTSGETGGTNGNISLTEANIPTHSHSYTPAGTIKSTFKGTKVNSGTQSANHTHTFSGTTSTNGAHTHTGASGTYRPESGYPTSSDGRYVIGNMAQTSSAGDHAHTYSGTTSANSANHYHSVTAAGTVTSTFTGTASNTGNTGSSTAFSVLDPYITVYMYKRVK